MSGIPDRLRGEAGVALPTAIFAIVMITVLIAGIWVSVDVNARSTRNREESLKAMQIAEAGANHALAVLNEELADTTYTSLLLGDDGLPLTDDDGILVGFGLDSGDEIPVSGVAFGEGTYTVQIVNDPADPTTDVVDTNDKIMLRCTGTTTRGGSAVVEAVIGVASVTQLPMIVVDGRFEISGNPELLGTCGAIHANDDLKIGGDTVVEEYVASSGDIDGKDKVKLPNGDDAPANENETEVAVPDFNNPTNSHCGNADYHLQANGWVKRVSDGALFDARSDEKFGWKRSGTGPVMWDYSSDDENPGTFCVFGNVTISGSPGEPTGTPVSMSVIASGSIEIGGNPLLTADDPDGYLLISGGDLKISGNPVGGSANYDGLLYARHQCDISGNPRMKAQILCKDLTSGSGVKNLVGENKISGDLENEYDCPFTSSSSVKRPVFAWSQRFGT